MVGEKEKQRYKEKTCLHDAIVRILLRSKYFY